MQTNVAKVKKANDSWILLLTINSYVYTHLQVTKPPMKLLTLSDAAPELRMQLHASFLNFGNRQFRSFYFVAD